MIAQFLDSAIVVLLVVLVAVPAATAITRTIRESANRRQTARVRDRQAVLPASPAVSYGAAESSPNHPTASAEPAIGLAPKQRESSEVYRRLRESRQNPRQTKPGDRARSPSEPPPGG